MVAWWLLVIAPFLAARLAVLLPRLADEEAPRPTPGAALACALILLVALTSMPGLDHLNPLLTLKSQAPVENDLERVRAKLLEEMPGRRIFTRFEWGEYLTWSFYPEFKVFMDGRIEIYPDHVWEEYSDLTQGKENWHEVLDQYRVDALVLDRDYHARTGLLPRVEAAGVWRRVFESGPALVYLRE
jgi:hypothetical protein